ncbi:MAG: hypothetical protein ACJ8AI_28305, partial [Rhodopila sp.]
MTHGTASQKMPPRRPLGHIALIALALAVVWSSIGATLWTHYHAVTEDAVKATDNLSRAFADDITCIADVVDQTLLSVRDIRAEKGAKFDLREWSRGHPAMKGLIEPAWALLKFLRHAWLRRAAERNRRVQEYASRLYKFELAIADRNGNVVQATSGPATPGINVGDQELFRSLASSAEDRLSIGQPMVARLTNRPSIVFGRRLTRPDGSFDGVVGALIDTAALSAFYDTMAIGNGAITLMNINGAVLARVPDSDAMFG